MKKVFIISLALLALTGCSSQAPDSAALSTEASTPVEIKSVQTSTANEIEMISDLIVPGQVKSNQLQTVSATVGGEIHWMTAEVGDLVTKDDVLVKLDDTFVRIQKRQAEVGNSLYKLALNAAQRSFENTESLYSSGTATKAQLDEVSDYLKRAELDAANGHINMDQVNYQINHMIVKAPMSGTISKKYQSLGASVGPGTPLFEIVDISILNVEAGITEMNINRLSNGQTVDVTIPSIGLVVKGIVKGISPIPGADQTYPVNIEIDNSDQIIKPGMYAELKIETEQAKKVIAVPKVAVFHEEDTDYVYVVKDAVAIKTAVVIGMASGDSFEILSGVIAGDEIVTSGQAYIEDGSSVNIKN